MLPVSRNIARSFLPSNQELSFVGSSLDKGKYKVTGFLGRGSSGAVIYRVSDEEGEHAVKRVDTRIDALEWSTKNEHILHSFVSEHPHVISYHGFFVDSQHTHLLTAVCEGGRLCDFVDETPLFWRNDENIRRVFLSIVRAVRYCHSRGIAHRDINPENVLAVDKFGDTFVLADFGKATTEKKSKQFGLGLAAYSAPECLAGESHTAYDTRIADVWSLGILLLNMVTGATPWTAPRTSHAAYTSFLSEPIHLQRILPVSGDLVALLARVLDPRPRRRMSIVELERAVVAMRSFSMSDAELGLEHRSAARGRVELRARLLGVPWQAPPIRSIHDSDSSGDSLWSRSGSSTTSIWSSRDGHGGSTLRRLSSLSLRLRSRPSSFTIKSRLSTIAA
ncbi:unnamed protein product [Peniophora sp. CBMAI 1063]|nr:unnamed protein product [Peniophora sp. CBMAI 1063]